MSPPSLIPTARVRVAPGKLMAVKVKDPVTGKAGVLCANAGLESSPNERAKARPTTRVRVAYCLERSNTPDRFICGLLQLKTRQVSNPSKRVRANFQSAVR